jgi:endonuclease-3 related protein
MKITIKQLFEALLEVYSAQDWWPAESPYEVMIGAILGQNTNWLNAEKALNNLGKNINPKFIDQITLEELRELIRPSGFYNQKANRIKRLNNWFIEYGYNIENVKKEDQEVVRNQLLDIKGIGHETADSILLYALNMPIFVIDSYTRRIFSRVGFSVPKKYDDFRIMIESGLKNSSNLLSVYNEFHGLLVTHAKEACLKSPQCEKCKISYLCSKKI